MAHKELHLKVTLRIYSDDDQRCFGPGIATLLQRVREHRSLRAGAASMEMAYSKAWRIIRTVIVPEALGPLILGYTFAFIAVVDMSAMAGYIGGGGLGDFAIVYGYRAFDWNVTLVTTLIIILIVQAAQLLGNFLAKKVMRR